MQDTGERSGALFLIGLGLVNAICFTLLLSTIGFIFNLPLSFWHFPLALVCALAVNFFAARWLLPEDRKAFIKNGIFVLAIVITSILIAGLFYDLSFDGQWYHQEMIYQLKQGWNPFRAELPDQVTAAIWLNHYPRGAEIPEAAIYCLTGRIEYGKSINFILFIASFFLALAFLLKIKWFKTWKAVSIAFLFAFHPVVIGQLSSFCLDGQMASILVCLLAAFAFLYYDLNRYYLLLLVSSIVITINLKFTGLPFSIIFVAAFILLVALQRRRLEFKRIAVACLVGFLLAGLFVGFNPYVTNTVKEHYTFYPLNTKLGKETFDLLSPGSFKHRNRLGKLMVSLFTHTNDYSGDVEPRPKIPFTLNKVDIVNAANPQIRMAGFGPFFSGAIVLSMIALGAIIFLAGHKSSLLRIGILLAFLALSVIIVDTAWCLKYVPQLWFLPLIIAVAAEWVTKRWMSWLRNAIYISLALNIGWAFLSIPYGLLKSAQIDYQLAQLKATKDPVTLDYEHFNSNRIRFYENDIPVREEDLQNRISGYLIHSTTRYYSPDTLPILPKPNLLRWNDALKRKLKMQTSF